MDRIFFAEVGQDDLFQADESGDWFSRLVDQWFDRQIGFGPVVPYSVIAVTRILDHRVDGRQPAVVTVATKINIANRILDILSLPLAAMIDTEGTIVCKKLQLG